MADDTIRLERSYPASPEAIWELWTTPAGIESWWAPDGFTCAVRSLDLREGGEMVYALTATAPEQVAFMQSHGMPLTTESRKTFTTVAAPHRLAYDSLIDFVPDHEPYEHRTTVEIAEAADGSATVVMTMPPLHDEVWTERIVAGRSMELDKLAGVLGAA